MPDSHVEHRWVGYNSIACRGRGVLACLLKPIKASSREMLCWYHKSSFCLTYLGSFADLTINFRSPGSPSIRGSPSSKIVMTYGRQQVPLKLSWPSIHDHQRLGSLAQAISDTLTSSTISDNKSNLAKHHMQHLLQAKIVQPSWKWRKGMESLITWFWGVPASTDTVRDSDWRTYCRLPHSSHSWVVYCWNIPGPNCRVTTLLRQLHCLLPLAGFITFLSRIICISLRSNKNCVHSNHISKMSLAENYKPCRYRARTKNNSWQSYI